MRVVVGRRADGGYGSGRGAEELVRGRDGGRVVDGGVGHGVGVLDVLDGGDFGVLLLLRGRRRTGWWWWPGGLLWRGGVSGLLLPLLELRLRWCEERGLRL